MGLFGSTARTPLDVMAMGQTPQQQNALPNYWDVIQAPAQNVQPQGPQGVQPHFFEKGGMGSKIGVGILGGLADGLAQWGGAPPGYRNAMQAKQEYEQRQQELQAQMQMRQQERQQSSADAWNMWQQQQDYQRENPDPTSIQRSTEYIASLPEGDPRRQIAMQQTPGYGNSAEVLAARLAQQQQLINDRAAAQRSVKMTAPGSNGGASHPPKYAIGPNGQIMKWVP